MSLMPTSGQYEDSEEVTVVERRFVLVTHRRAKYRCRCNGAVVTAPGPDKLIPGGRYSVEFAVEVAAGKYLDHLPLERQSRQMAREGLAVDTQTLWNQIEALARHLQPAYEALRGKILASDVLHADETWWRLMQGKGSKRWWSWSISNEEAAHYRIAPQRSTEAAREVLGGYRGTVMADGYGVYESLSRAGPGFTLANCWSHARRNFVEIEPNYPRECGEVLSLIGELYGVERLAPRLVGLQGAEREEALQVRARLRTEHSRPLVERIWQWATSQTGTPESGLRKAIMYLLERRAGLTRFLDDPRVPLDNNAAERALRGMVLGRKNHYGSRSLRGTQVAALFYSLLETAKLCVVEPKAYLRAAALAAIREPGRAFLPEEFKRISE
jgi:transposase